MKKWLEDASLTTSLLLMFYYSYAKHFYLFYPFDFDHQLLSNIGF